MTTPTSATDLVSHPPARSRSQSAWSSPTTRCGIPPTASPAEPRQPRLAPWTWSCPVTASVARHEPVPATGGSGVAEVPVAHRHQSRHGIGATIGPREVGGDPRRDRSAVGVGRQAPGRIGPDAGLAEATHPHQEPPVTSPSDVAAGQRDDVVGHRFVGQDLGRQLRRGVRRAVVDDHHVTAHAVGHDRQRRRPPSGGSQTISCSSSWAGTTTTTPSIDGLTSVPTLRRAAPGEAETRTWTPRTKCSSVCRTVVRQAG